MKRNITMPETTPWGPVQNMAVVGDGLIQVSTAGHGGLWLSPERWVELKRKFPGYIEAYAPAQWLEEDCDYCVAVLVWPELFGIESVRSALVTFAQGDYQPAIVAWVRTSPEAAALREQVQAWERANAAMWETGSMSTTGNGWSVWMHRVGDRAEQVRIFAEYPALRRYTDGQLEKASRPAEVKVATARALPVRFNESDCGGVFDGRAVWSETELGGAPGF